VSIFDDVQCLAWKADPQFWQGVAALKAAQAAGAINNMNDCMQAAQAGSQVAAQFGIPTFLGNSFGNCACNVVFGGGNPAPPDPLISLPVFSPDFYIGIYPDLEQAFGRNGYGAATAHWQNTGSVVEGRMSSPVFNVKYYLRSNPDLVAAFGQNGFRSAVQHWIHHHGVDETRRSAYIFDVNYYLANNPDIVKAFGAGVRGAKAATVHWVQMGLPVEGRQGSADFSPKAYLAANPALINAYGANGWYQATMHWIINGNAEPR